jgi:hypothetical protein
MKKIAYNENKEHQNSEVHPEFYLNINPLMKICPKPRTM